MELTDYLAFLAILVSLLSALYSRQAVVNSKRANNISLHAHMTSICDELNSFMHCFRGMHLPDFDRLHEFKNKAVLPSEIYFSASTHQFILEIFDRCKLHHMYLSVAETGEQFNEYEIRDEYESEGKLVQKALELAIQETKNAIA